MKKSLLVGLALSPFCILSACGSDEPAEDDGLGGGGGEFVVEGTGGKSNPEGGGTGGSAQGTGGGSGGATPSRPPIEHCTLNGEETRGSADGELLYDDFDDGDAFFEGNGRYGDWYQYDDETSTQTPSWNDADGWLPEPGGLTQDGYALHAVGAGFTEWGSGQGTVPAWDPEAETECLYDASAFDGVSFWLKGEVVNVEGSASPTDQGVIKFGITEPEVVPVESGGVCTGDQGQCWDWHKTRVVPGECWHRYAFRFDELKQDGWGADADELEMDKMINFNFEVSQGHSYDFWVDDMRFFVGEKPAEDEICDDGMGGAGGAGGAAGAGNQ